MKWVLFIALSVSFVVDHQIQDVDIAGMDSSDEALWLDPQQPSGLLLRRAARPGDERGSVLILGSTDAGPNASTHVATARRQLPFHGWHSYFARVPQANAADSDAVNQAVLGYVELVRGRSQERLVLIAEGSVAVACVALLEGLDVDAVVLVNLPTDGIPRDLLEGLTLPSLVLQESPNHWPKELPLGPDVELHLLSRVDARREDNRLLRKIRGWFKRRFDEA